MDQVVARHENLKIYGDEDDGEPKGEVVNYSLMTSVELKPSYYEQACTNDLWMKTMDVNMNYIKRNDTLELVELRKDKGYVGSKWIFKLNYNSDGTIKMHKTSLVAKGFTQRCGIGYE